MNKSQIALQKSLYLLDKGKIADGEMSLREAIKLAEKESDEIILFRSMSCLGELLFELERRDEAIELLRPVAQLKRDDDLLNYEISLAKKLVNHIQSYLP